MQCPTCGSTEVYRSRRGGFERIFNWLFWYQQRPYRCAACMTRYWIRLEPHVWWHTFRKRTIRAVRVWGFYIGALLVAGLVAWSLNFVRQRAQESNPIIDAAMKQEMMNRLNETDLTEDQKEQAKRFFEQKR